MIAEAGDAAHVGIHAVRDSNRPVVPRWHGHDPAIQAMAARARVVAVAVRRAAISAAPSKAYRTLGEGHPSAALNLGDCAAYALAKSLDAPLLFKGDDFARTDVRRALVELLLLLELERGAVHAVAVAGRLRAVGEDVAEMAAALGAGAPRCGSCRGWCRSWCRPRRASAAQNDGQPEPLSYLVAGIEQRLAAAGAAEDAGALFVVQRAGEGPLGAVLAQHVMLQRIEFLLPLGVGFSGWDSCRSCCLGS